MLINTVDVTPRNGAKRNTHVGDVLVHDSTGTRLISQEMATKLGWDGESPVMYLNSDGSIRFVCPGVK